jgi:hypothetical protein
MCAKCKLQMGKHPVDHQAQLPVTSGVQMSTEDHNYCAINCQCHHYIHNDVSENKDNAETYDSLNFKECIKLQKALRNCDNLINTQQNSDTVSENLINKVDNEIFLINESLPEQLLIIANKLLGRHNLSFDQLTSPEQELWKLFEKSDIYKFLTGEKDTLPEFRHNYAGFSANQNSTSTLERPLPLPGQPLMPLLIQRAHSAPSPSVSHNLRERKNKINYRTLHLGREIQQATAQDTQDLTQQCKSIRKSVRKSAKAAVTKLTPWAFSSKVPGPATVPRSPPHSSSSSSWNFWLSK